MVPLLTRCPVTQAALETGIFVTRTEVPLWDGKTLAAFCPACRTIHRASVFGDDVSPAPRPAMRREA